jgi:hypothetical protein
MALPLNAFQAAIYTRLVGYSGLTTALGGSKIYDHLPQNVTAPYVVIGDDTCIVDDTKSNNGWELTATIHCWDFEKAGRKSVKTLMSNIYDALHKSEANITVTGFSLVQIYQEFSETFQEVNAEGASDHFYHGVQRFRAIITDTSI